MPNLKPNDSTAAGSAEVRYYSRLVEALNLGGSAVANHDLAAEQRLGWIPAVELA